MPAPPPSHTGRTGFSVALWSLLSGVGLFYSLQEKTRWKAEATLSKWQSGVGVEEDLKLLGDEVLEAVMQSSCSTVFLLNSTLAVWATSCLVTKSVFLGRLTVLEQAKLAERMLKFLLLKVVFLGAVVNPTAQDIATWLLWFLGMAYLKSFTSLARDRCEALLSSPSSTLMQHVRCLTLLLGILVNLVHWVASYLGGLDPRDSSRLGYAMLWLFDAIIIAVEAAHALTKYGVHAAERWRVLRAEERGEEGAEPWAGRGPFLYYLELATDLTLHTLTLAHYAHLWLLHGLRLSLTDAVLFLDVRHLAGGTWQRIRGHRRYLRLTHQLEHSFPCASAGALAEAECAICLSGFSAAGQSAKELPCSHVFHLSCLRAWLQQSKSGCFSCPMCRADLFLQQQTPKHQGQHLATGCALPPASVECRQRGAGRACQAHEPEGQVGHPAAGLHGDCQASPCTVGVSQQPASSSSPAGSISSQQAVILHHVRHGSLPRLMTHLQQAQRFGEEQEQVTPREPARPQQDAGPHHGRDDPDQEEGSIGPAYETPVGSPTTLTAELLGMAVSHLSARMGTVVGSTDVEDDAASPDSGG